jgi:hypothetical protein
VHSILPEVLILLSSDSIGLPPCEGIGWCLPALRPLLLDLIDFLLPPGCCYCLAQTSISSHTLWKQPPVSCTASVFALHGASLASLKAGDAACHTLAAAFPGHHVVRRTLSLPGYLLHFSPSRPLSPLLQ